jgi:hypothetical protein
MAWGDSIAKPDGKASCGLQEQGVYHLNLALNPKQTGRDLTMLQSMLLIHASGKIFDPTVIRNGLFTRYGTKFDK